MDWFSENSNMMGVVATDILPVQDWSIKDKDKGLRQTQSANTSPLLARRRHLRDQENRSADQENASFAPHHRVPKLHDRAPSPALSLRQLDFDEAPNIREKAVVKVEAKRTRDLTKQLEATQAKLRDTETQRQTAIEQVSTLQTQMLRLKAQLDDLTATSKHTQQVVDRNNFFVRASSDHWRTVALRFEKQLEQSQDERVKLLTQIEELRAKVKRYRLDRGDSEQLVKELNDKLVVLLGQRKNLQAQCNNLQSQVLHVLAELQRKQQSSRPPSYGALEDTHAPNVVRCVATTQTEPPAAHSGNAASAAVTINADLHRKLIEAQNMVKMLSAEQRKTEAELVQACHDTTTAQEQAKAAHSELQLHSDALMALLSEERARCDLLRKQLGAEHEATRQHLEARNRALTQAREATAASIGCQEEADELRNRLNCILSDHQNLQRLMLPYLQLALEHGLIEQESRSLASHLLAQGQQDSNQVEHLKLERHVLRQTFDVVRRCAALCGVVRRCAALLYSCFAFPLCSSTVNAMHVILILCSFGSIHQSCLFFCLLE
ncbi:uncharacterized protein MONBRDRAFT_23312 [Monosiga brevicollis MX1]|uniref:Uncharacterized protein n=1 Tax=Monosiga brevicollis TaxID=81824 RepID=A9UT08_MONBE|nr:uncharacterized protein MONBRDRAFT_23312 [Monosiga brevicollis MX1]EDQ91414.1 predicted protein [Monosiga brevicollis MX1]|eukprot:XP_001743836.1 hypothetical protein [Monosiga brevicollis MX1]